MFKLGSKSLKKQLIFFLRSTKNFTKSRYSRGRQWSKVIVFFGLWFNLGSVLGTFFFTYQASLRIAYLWWVLFFLTNLFILRLYISRTNIKPNFKFFIQYLLKQYVFVKSYFGSEILKSWFNVNDEEWEF